MIRNFFNKGGGGDVTNDTEPQDTDITNIEDIHDNAETEASQENQQPQQQSLRESELTNKLIRLQADFDNFRKRSLAGRAEAREEARREVILDLLPVYDNFLRAMSHAAEMEDYGALHTGIESILQQLREVLSRHGCIEIDAQPGTTFDPNLHDATGTLEGTAEQQGSIAQELVKGFLLNASVIRPAQVIVYTSSE